MSFKNKEKMKKSRAIVDDIVKEIEERVYSSHFDEELIKQFQETRKEIEDQVSKEFSREVPDKHISKIRTVLGEEFLEFLNQGKIGPLVWKGKDRLKRIYKKLATLIELYLYYKKESQEKALNVEYLKKVRDELIDSQVSHVHEIETLDIPLNEYRFLVETILEPFEVAIKKIMGYLKVKQIEVFLFDDDNFLATEMKTDGETFTYNDEEEKHNLPEAISEVKFKEINETTIDVPLVVEGKQMGHYRLNRKTSEVFNRELWIKDVERMTPFVARIIEANRNQLLARKVYIDDLTQMYNKRKLNEQMGKFFKQFKSGNKKLHIAMVDIDKFKRLNDTYGHPVGDQILKRTAEIIKEELPYSYRYGGEEFAGIFYGYDRETTMEKVESLRKRIENTPYVIKGQNYRITISAGIAEFETHMNSVMDAIDHADQALYASKEDGRNRCTDYDDIKDRLSADAAKLRQEIMQLKEKMKKVAKENKLLAKQATKKESSKEA
jgi:diguanylate cyclase (GGDEF)-like protein